MRAPGSAELGTAAMVWPGSGDCGPVAILVGGMRMVGVEAGAFPGGAVVGVGTGKLGVRRGVAGALGEGDADSTTHMR